VRSSAPPSAPDGGPSKCQPAAVAAGVASKGLRLDPFDPLDRRWVGSGAEDGDATSGQRCTSATRHECPTKPRSASAGRVRYATARRGSQPDPAMVRTFGGPSATARSACSAPQPAVAGSPACNAGEPPPSPMGSAPNPCKTGSVSRERASVVRTGAHVFCLTNESCCYPINLEPARGLEPITPCLQAKPTSIRAVPGRAGWAAICGNVRADRVRPSVGDRPDRAVPPRFLRLPCPGPGSKHPLLARGTLLQPLRRTRLNSRPYPRDLPWRAMAVTYPDAPHAYRTQERIPQWMSSSRTTR
jgi:hypothetical protein